MGNNMTTKTTLVILLCSTFLVLTSCARQIKDPGFNQFEKAQQEINTSLAKEPKVEVLITKVEMKKGEKFKEENLIFAPIPKSKVPPGALVVKKSVVGKTAAADIEVGGYVTGQLVNP